MSDHTIVIIRVVKILLDTKSWFIGKDPDAGKDWEQKEKGALENEIVDGITDRMDVSLSKPWEIVKDKEGWHVVVHGVTKSQIQLSNNFK